MKPESEIDKQKENYQLINDDEDDEQFYPVQSMIIENEWISTEMIKHKTESISIATFDTNKNDFDNEKKNDDSDSLNYSIEESESESPYFQTARINKNENAENVRFISPLSKTKNIHNENTYNNSSNLNRSILNELLPTQVQLEESNFGGNGETGWWFENDKIYGYVFKVSFIMWTLFTIYLINSASNSNSLPIDIGKDKMIFEKVGWFGLLLVIGLGVSAVWARVLAEQTETVVYGLILIVPTGLIGLGFFAFSNWYVLAGFVCLLMAGLLLGVIWGNRKNLMVTVEIVRTAAIFIQSTPKVYWLVLQIVGIYVVFVLIWLLGFIRLFDKNMKFSFVFTSSLQILFVFMLFWVGAVLSTIQKFTIATWVRSWLNHTEDQTDKIEIKLMNENSFGTICLASAILSSARLIRFITRTVQFSTKLTGNFLRFGGPISELFGWILTLVTAAERLIQRFTDFSIYYLAVEENVEGFLSASRGLGRVLDGHVGLALTADSTAQLLLTFSTALISFASTALLLFITKTQISWTSSAFIALLVASVTDYVACTYTSAIDATFLCYLMDLRRNDRAGKIDSQLHAAFSSKLESV